MFSISVIPSELDQFGSGYLGSPVSPASSAAAMSVILEEKLVRTGPEQEPQDRRTTLHPTARAAAEILTSLPRPGSHPTQCSHFSLRYG